MYARFDFDDAFPGAIDVAAVVEGLKVGDGASGIDSEEEGVAPVEKGVEGEAEEITVTRGKILYPGSSL